MSRRNADDGDDEEEDEEERDESDEDVQVLTELGLVERDDTGGVVCPFADVHIDMHVHPENAAA
jgi:hypothetical protein